MKNEMSGLERLNVNTTAYDKPKRLDELVDIFKLKDIPLDIRLLPERKGINMYMCYGQHWIRYECKSGTKSEIRIPKICLNITQNGDYVENGCPYCAKLSRDNGAIPQIRYMCEVIDRNEQEKQPARMNISKQEESSGIKDPDSSSWTPVKILVLPKTAWKLLCDLKEGNAYRFLETGTGKYVLYNDENKKKYPDCPVIKHRFPVDHPKFGCDVSIAYRQNEKSFVNRYSIQMQKDKSPITEEESNYLVYNLDFNKLVKEMGIETEQEANSWFEKNAHRIFVDLKSSDKLCSDSNSYNENDSDVIDVEKEQKKREVDDLSFDDEDLKMDIPTKGAKEKSDFDEQDGELKELEKRSVQKTKKSSKPKPKKNYDWGL